MKRALSASLVILIFFSNVVLGYAAETNFWTERRHHLVPVSKPTSLSLDLPNRPKIIDKNFSSSFVRVQDIFNPSGNTDRPLLIFQDIHMNLEAQQNIAKGLLPLVENKSLGIIGVEGAFGGFDFEPFRRFSLDIRKETAESFLSRNLIAAPTYIGLIAQNELPSFVGLDDPALYRANVESYLKTTANRHPLSVQLKSLKKSLRDQKNSAYSPLMRKWDDLHNAYVEQSIGFGDYIRGLVAMGEKPEEDIQLYLEALDLEASLDFPGVERERMRVLEELSKKLNQDKVSWLTAKS